jgi:flagellar motor switch protein FliM
MAETQLAVLAPEMVTGGERVGVLPSWIARIESHPAWPLLSQLPMTLNVRITLNRLKVSDLLSLEKGQILESSWSQTSDVPLAIGEVRLGWSEFEVSGQQIGVRLTQLV